MKNNGEIIKNDAKKSLTSTNDQINNQFTSINTRYTELETKQKNGTTLTDEEKKEIDTLKAQRDQLVQEKKIVSKIQSDPKLFEQWVTHELSMAILFLSTFDDKGKMIPFVNPKTGEDT